MKTIRQQLLYKLFFSYLIIIVVGVISTTIAVRLVTPAIFNRHMIDMGGMMGSNSDGMMVDLSDSFQGAIDEILLVATLFSIVTALLVSLFVTRRIVTPVKELNVASQRIATGRYDDRVEVIGDDELADLARAFNRMAHALAHTETRRRQLIGDVAHELRTPLSSIKSVMEGLIDGVLPPEPATFNNVQREVIRLQRLVHDLEELSKAEAGELSLERLWVHPGEIIEAAVSRLKLQYQDKDVALTINVPENLPQIHADQARLIQVLLNLLGNALQYSGSGNQVTVTAAANDQTLTITIADEGIGIGPEALPHIFERFYRVDKSRSRTGGGSGVGLTISQHLVEAHNGQLTAASPGLGLGSTFTLILPLEEQVKRSES